MGVRVLYARPSPLAHPRSDALARPAERAGVLAPIDNALRFARS